MRITHRQESQGIALIIVMIVITVLSMLAGGFAKSMKVETRLANHGSNESAMDWLARSGVEHARFVLALQGTLSPGLDTLNQKWAGGTGETNEVLAGISLEDNPLGQGKFSIRITDQERKLNINFASDEMFQQALDNLGVDPREAGGIIDSFKDWVDRDDHPHLMGAESDDYLAKPNPGFPPHFAKNGAVEDPSELLMLRGFSAELYYGPSVEGTRFPSRTFTMPTARRTGLTVARAVGFRDLFVAIGGPQVNINTASVDVLSALPGVPFDVAAGIVRERAGFNGIDGDEDDRPWRNVGELINVPGVSRGMMGALQRFCTVRSTTFEVEVDAAIGDFHRSYAALLRRTSNRDVLLIYMHPK